MPVFPIIKQQQGTQSRYAKSFIKGIFIKHLKHKVFMIQLLWTDRYICLHRSIKKWAVATVLYLNLDLITELLQTVHKLLCLRVRNPEHHLQPGPPSCSSSHHHAKVMLCLKLHISLDKTRTIMSMAKIDAANQIKRQQWWGSGGQGRGLTRERRQSRCWFFKTTVKWRDSSSEVNLIRMIKGRWQPKI